MRLFTLRGGFDKNLCYIVHAAGSRKAALIDAAVSAGEIFDALERLGLELSHVLITHGHADHHASAQEVLERTGATLGAFKASPVLTGLRRFRTNPLRDGSQILVPADAKNPLRFEALFTPGHAPDHLCYHLPEQRALFTGDALFIGRPGRTVHAGSDPRLLYRSLRDKILPLPDDTLLYPGHDYGVVPSRTLGEERAENPWLQAESEDAFVALCEAYEQRRREKNTG